MVGLGPVAGDAAARLCRALGVDRLREAVLAVTPVLDAEGMGRLAAPALAAALEPVAGSLARERIEEALGEAWGYRMETITAWGEPIGAYEVPVSVLGRATRRVDAEAGVRSFTIVNDTYTGEGFVGVWDEAGRLLWAPPLAKDLRFHAGAAELLFDSWRERRAFPSRELLARTPHVPFDGRNLRLAIAPGSGRACVISYESARSNVQRFWVDGVEQGAFGGDAPCATDIAFSPSEAYAVILTPGEEGALSDKLFEKEVSMGFLRVFPITRPSGGAGANMFVPWHAELPVGDLHARRPPVFLSEYEIELVSPFGDVVRFAVDRSWIVPPADRANRPRWVDAPPPSRVRRERLSVTGDHGRRLFEVEAPASVDFEPIPVWSVARGPDGLVGFTLRPFVGKAPEGLATYAFPAGGAGVTGVWNASTGALVHAFDAPGEMQWLEDDVLLLFRTDSLEALRWPELHTMWRIPLASPLAGAMGPGLPSSLAIAPDRRVAAVLWQRPIFRDPREAGYAYELVDLGDAPAQRFGSGYSQWRGNEVARGPVFDATGRWLATSESMDVWWWDKDAEGRDVFRGPNRSVMAGRVVLHDLETGLFYGKSALVTTPREHTAPAWQGLDILGPVTFEADGHLACDTGAGVVARMPIEPLGEPRDGRKVAPLRSRPRCRVAMGSPPAPFPVPFELPHTFDGHDESQAPTARRVSWSPARDRVAMALTRGTEDRETAFCGIWNRETGSLEHAVDGHTAAFTAAGDRLIVARLEQLVSRDLYSSIAWPIADLDAPTTDMVLSPDGRSAALVAERGTFFALCDLETGSVHAFDVRHDASFRGPVWSADSRWVAVVALHDEADLVVVDRTTMRVRETVLALQDHERVAELSLTPEGTWRLGIQGADAFRAHLSDHAPGETSSRLPIPLLVPFGTGLTALQMLGVVPWRRLDQLGIPLAQTPDVLHRVTALEWLEGDEDEEERLSTGIAAIFEREEAATHYGEGAVLAIPLLIGLAADPELRLRPAIVDALVHAHGIAKATDDAAALAAFAAMQEMLGEAAATSPALAKLLR